MTIDHARASRTDPKSPLSHPLTRLLAGQTSARVTMREPQGPTPRVPRAPVAIARGHARGGLPCRQTGQRVVERCERG